MYSSVVYKYSAQGSPADPVEFCSDCCAERRVPRLEGRRVFLRCVATVSFRRGGFGTPLEGDPAACLGAGGFLQFKMTEAEALVEVT